MLPFVQLIGAGITGMFSEPEKPAAEGSDPASAANREESEPPSASSASEAAANTGRNGVGRSPTTTRGETGGSARLGSVRLFRLFVRSNVDDHALFHSVHRDFAPLTLAAADDATERYEGGCVVLSCEQFVHAVRERFPHRLTATSRPRQEVVEALEYVNVASGENREKSIVGEDAPSRSHVASLQAGEIFQNRFDGISHGRSIMAVRP